MSISSLWKRFLSENSKYGSEEAVDYSSLPMEPIVRQRITVYGRVQAVGFRYRAQMAAKELHLTGYVKNQDDGSVLMEIQGSWSRINAMLELLSNSPYIRIERTIREDLPMEAAESSFRVQHS